MPKNEQPAGKFRIGFVTATVWKNGDFFNVNLSRSYKDDNGDWQNGDSFGHADLLNAARALERAESFIADQ